MKNHGTKNVIVLLATLTAGMGCGEGGLTVPLTQVVSGEVTPATMPLKVGETGTLKAQLRDGTGAVASSSSSAEWSWVADPTGVVTLAVDANTRGVTLTGAKVGQTTIRAQQTNTGIGNATIIASALVTVVAAPQVVTTLNLVPGSMEIGMGETGVLTCTPTDQNGVVMNNVALQWTSAANGVATVANGTVTAVSPGPAVITCREPVTNLSKTAVVTVRARVLTLVPTSLTLEVDQHKAATPTVTDFRGNRVNYPLASITYTPAAGGQAIATATAGINAVDILGVSVGTTTFTARLAEGDASAALAVAVTAKAATSLTFTPSSLEISMGASDKFTCTPLDAQGATLAIGVAFTSSDPGVATVVAGGTVTAVGLGTSTITCKEPNSGLTKTGVVTVRARTLTLSPSTIAVTAGQHQAITTTVKDFRGNVMNYNPLNIIWTSLRSEVAFAVENANGADMISLLEGTTTLTAKLKEGDATATVPVTVTSATACRASTALTYNVTVVSDPGGNTARVAMPATMTVTITKSQTGSITATGPTPFITAGGVLNETSCALHASGLGLVGATPNIKGDLSGTYNFVGKLVLTYVVGLDAGVGNIAGLNGNLPITYKFTEQ